MKEHNIDDLLKKFILTPKDLNININELKSSYNDIINLLSKNSDTVFNDEKDKNIINKNTIIQNDEYNNEEDDDIHRMNENLFKIFKIFSYDEEANIYKMAQKFHPNLRKKFISRYIDILDDEKIQSLYALVNDCDSDYLKLKNNIKNNSLCNKDLENDFIIKHNELFDEILINILNIAYLQKNKISIKFDSLNVYNIIRYIYHHEDRAIYLHYLHFILDNLDSYEDLMLQLEYIEDYNCLSFVKTYKEIYKK